MSAVSSFTAEVPARSASAPEPASTTGNEDPDMNYTRTKRTMSNSPSFVSVATIPVHGNCPRCSHWHNKFLVRFSLSPQQYTKIKCQRCSHPWFSLGRNSTHSSLLSQETRTSEVEDRSPSLALAVCTSGSVAVAAPHLQNSPHLSAVVEDSVDRSTPSSSKHSPAQGLQFHHNAFESRITADPSADFAITDEQRIQPSMQPPLQQEPKSRATQDDPSGAPLKKLVRGKGRFKRFFEHLGFEVEFKVKRVKRPRPVMVARSDKGEAVKEGISSLDVETEPTVERYKANAPHVSIPEEVEDLQEGQAAGDQRHSLNLESDVQLAENENRSQIHERRKAKRREKTLLAKSSQAKYRPVRCVCSSNCRCHRGSESSVNATASQSAPDLLHHAEMGPGNFDPDELISMKRQQGSQGPPRSISPLLVHAGAGFNGPLPRASTVTTSEGSQEQSSRTQRRSATSATAARTSGSGMFTESPRGSMVTLGIPTQSIPSPAASSSRSPLHRTSTQEDILASRSDSGATEIDARDFRSLRDVRENSDPAFSGGLSSSFAGASDPKNHHVSVNTMASYQSFQQLRRPMWR